MFEGLQGGCVFGYSTSKLHVYIMAIKSLHAFEGGTKSFYVFEGGHEIFSTCHPPPPAVIADNSLKSNNLS